MDKINNSNLNSGVMLDGGTKGIAKGRTEERLKDKDKRGSDIFKLKVKSSVVFYD